MFHQDQALFFHPIFLQDASVGVVGGSSPGSSRCASQPARCVWFSHFFCQFFGGFELTLCQPARKVLCISYFFRWVRVNMASMVDIVLFKVFQRQRLSGGQLVHIRFDISLPMSFRRWVSLCTFLKGLWIGWFGLIFNDTLQKSNNLIYFDVLYIVEAIIFGVSLLTISVYKGLLVSCHEVSIVGLSPSVGGRQS